MKVHDTKIKEVKIVEPNVFTDPRGTFAETFSEKWFAENIAQVKFVQDNQSFSVKGVIRGLHLQKPPHQQAKLVRAITGRILDVAVDLRPQSPTFRRWVAVELSGENRRQLFIPAGLAHGFVALEDTIVAYKVSDFYHPELDGGVRWNDPTLAIDWGIQNPILSDKDAALPYL